MTDWDDTVLKLKGIVKGFPHMLVKWANTAPAGVVSFLLKIVGLYAFSRYIINEMLVCQKQGWWDAARSSPYILILVFMAVLFASLPLVKDIASVRHRKMTLLPFGSAQHNSPYDILKFFDKSTQHAIIVGLNLCAVLQMHKVIDRIHELLDQGATVTIVLATKELNEATGQERLTDLKESVEALNQLEKWHWDNHTESTDRDRLKIRSHPDAASMSALMRDPDDARRAKMVVTIKWATDNTPNRRLFFVATEWENSDVFRDLYGPASRWTSPAEGQSLQSICGEVGVRYHGEATS